jgi:hypothetical protein
MTPGDGTGPGPEQPDADDDVPVAAGISWAAFLSAPHIPITAWEND